MTVLSCQGLTKRYGGTLAIDALDLELEAGQPIALIGPNGAGKTTLMSLLCAFIRPSSGRVQVLGQPVGSAALSGRVACLPQDALLDPHRSIGRQLTELARLQGFGRRDAGKETDRVLEIVGLSDSRTQRPVALSHGMRKRIALAQSLMGSPELVLLDEPTAGIDPPNVRLIRKLISEQSDRITFLISSHNLDELERLCAHVVYLEKGRLLRSAALDESSQTGMLTLRMGTDADEFESACLALSSVRSLKKQAQGEWLLEVEDEMAASVQLMQLLHEQGWAYRSLTRGRSLEEQLYG